MWPHSQDLHLEVIQHTLPVGPVGTAVEAVPGLPSKEGSGRKQGKLLIACKHGGK